MAKRQDSRVKGAAPAWVPKAAPMNPALHVTTRPAAAKSRRAARPGTTVGALTA